MEKQFDLKQHPATKDFLILDENGETAASSYKDSLLVKFKLSDIGIDDVGQIAKENIDVYCSEDNRELSGFINGYNKAKQKYKYTEDDIRKAFKAGSMHCSTEGKVYPQSIDIEGLINLLNVFPTKVWLEMEDDIDPNYMQGGENPNFEPRIKVDKNNYVKILRYE